VYQRLRRASSLALHVRDGSGSTMPRTPAEERLRIALFGRGIGIPKRRRRYVFIQRQFERNGLGAFLVALSQMRRKVMIGHDRHLSLCNILLSRFCATCKQKTAPERAPILQGSLSRMSLIAPNGITDLVTGAA
jgi:hypothetical protein